MREDLQRQIDEKNAKKNADKSMRTRQDLNDEIRVRQQMRDMAIAEGVGQTEEGQEKGSELLMPVKQLSEALAQENLKASMKTNYQGSSNNQLVFSGIQQQSINSRKTAYAANQHSVSIIGSDTGTIHQPQNFLQPGDNANSGQDTIAIA